MRIPVIINPAANSARAAALIEKIRRLSPEPDVHVTSKIGHATQTAQELAQAGHPIVVAAGGDGTVNEVLNGLAMYNASIEDPKRHVKLGILPVGTMNVMAHELGLPGRDLDAGWALISAGATKEIDLWQANQQYFAQLAGVGLDAEIVQATTWEAKKKFGPLSYVMSAMQVLGREASVLSVEIEGRPPLFGSVVLIGNGKHYGGPVPVFRNACNTDGLLDIIVFRERRLLEVLQFLAGLTFDGYQQCEDIDYVQASAFKVTSASEVPFELDGELGANTPVSFSKAAFPLQVVTGK